MNARAWFAIRLVAVAIAIGVAVSCLLEQTACTPEQIDHVRTAAPPVIRAGCILLRAVTTDGTLLEACATAEELAPLIPELLEERETRHEPDAGAVALAFSLEAPKNRIPRRRCVAWQERKNDAGSNYDAGDAGRGTGADGSGRAPPQGSEEAPRHQHQRDGDASGRGADPPK